MTFSPTFLVFIPLENVSSCTFNPSFTNDLSPPSSPSAAASSGCRRARRGRGGWSCGVWASGTATPWSLRLEVQRSVRGPCMPCVCLSVCVPPWLKVLALKPNVNWLHTRRPERDPFHHTGPEISGLLLLRHPAGLL